MRHKTGSGSKRPAARDEVKSFNEFQQTLGPGDKRDLGRREVPLKRITGSVGRYHDFDHRFRLKKNLPSERFNHIKEALRAGKRLPPVDLYKIKNEYYVSDGNHRVAAAKELGWDSIEAHIIEYLPSKETLANILYRQKSDFEVQTGLHDKIELTEVGQYGYLLEQIKEQRAALAEITEKPVSLQNAAKDWYETIYRPCVKIIAESRLPEAFADRTIADLYAYITFYQWQKGGGRRYGSGIERLISGSMAGFRADVMSRERIDPPEMTHLTTAFVLINVATQKDERVMEKLDTFEEILELHAVPGEFDIIAKIGIKRDLLTSDSEVVGRFVNRIRALPGVLKTQTIIPIASKYKSK